MKAVVYEGPRQVTVKEVPDARIERPTDVLVRITSANICGSDLHMYEGRTDFEPGRWFGHENLGEVVEVGEGVDKVQVGDYVVLPFNISCGHCKNCERQLTNYCLTAQPEPNMAGAAYGFADMGPYGGGQAELLRVPWGDFNCLRLGEDAEQRQSDYVMLADIFPTCYYATEMAGVSPVTDGHLRRRPGRAHGHAVGDHSGGEQGHGRRPAPRPAETRRVHRRARHRRLEGRSGTGRSRRDDGVGRGQRLRVCRLPGARAQWRGAGQPDHEPVGRLGAFHREDRQRRRLRAAGSGRSDELAKQGKLAFDYGLFWFKGQHIGSGQAPVKKYNRQLRDLIAAGKAEPSFIVSHELPLEQAPEAYEHFDKRDEGWTKVVLHPAMAGA